MASRAAHLVLRSSPPFRLCTSQTSRCSGVRTGRRSQSTSEATGADALRLLRMLLNSRSDPEPMFSPRDFPEEPIGYPARVGFGFFQGGPGDRLGEKGRYEIRAKLGFGVTSSVWLARDWEASCAGHEYVTIKILTGGATMGNKLQRFRELEIGKLLSSSQPSQPVNGKGKKMSSRPTNTATRHRTAHASRLLDHFFLSGVEEDDGEHLCFVNELYPTDLQSIIDTMGKKPLPVRVAKRVLKDVMLGLAQLHELGIAHTDLKPDSIMVDPGTRWKQADAIEGWLEKHPPRRSTPLLSPSGMKSSWLTQPGLPLLERLESCKFVLSDFGFAQFTSQKTGIQEFPIWLSPPEGIISLPDWNEKVDIWEFGVLAFRLLTGKMVFGKANTGSTLDSAVGMYESMLYQMMCTTGEGLPSSLLNRGSTSVLYFRPPGGKLRNFDTYEHTPIWEQLMQESDRVGLRLSRQDFRAIVDLLLKCLRMDPEKRSSAKELARHPWLD